MDNNRNMINLPEGTILQNGKYKIIRFISSGGFGCTYEALHVKMNARVAIKEFFFKDYCHRNQDTNCMEVVSSSREEMVMTLRRKFHEEAQSVFGMNHPNIVRVIDIFEENDTAYYAMEYIDGETMQQMKKRRGAIPENEAIMFMLQLCDAMEYVHALKRLHLDIKPGNLMIDKSGRLKLIDFGASKHYDHDTGQNDSTLQAINTIGYAPVEQTYTGGFSDFCPATDIYAMGATLFTMLTGITPPSSVKLMSGDATLPPLPSSVSQSTRMAIYRAMRSSRKDRYQSINEFREALQGTFFADADTSFDDQTSTDNHGRHYPSDDTKIVDNNQYPGIQTPSDPYHRQYPADAPYRNGYSQGPVYPQPEPQSQNWKIITIVVLLVATCVIGYLAYTQQHKNKQGEISANTTSINTAAPVAEAPATQPTLPVATPIPAERPVTQDTLVSTTKSSNTHRSFYFTGALTRNGERFPIKMWLNVDTNGNVSGKYAYDKTLSKYGTGPKCYFYLKGTYSDGHFNLRCTMYGKSEIFEQLEFYYNGSSAQGTLICVSSGETLGIDLY